MTDIYFTLVTENVRTFNSFTGEIYLKGRKGNIFVTLEDCLVSITLNKNFDFWYKDFLCQEVFSNEPLQRLNGTFFNNGSNVDFYIMDSGINFTHQEFDTRAINLPNFIDEFSNSQGVPQGQDVTGSGSLIASLIGGNKVGILENANLYAVKIFDESNNWTQTNLNEAVSKIIEHHTTKITGNKSVVFCGIMESITENNSFIPPNNSLDSMQNSIRLLYEANIPVVVPAGDGFKKTDGSIISRLNSKFTRPARMPEVISVGALTEFLTTVGFTNYGSSITFWCPGISLSGSSYESNTAYSSGSGTKYAAALATAVVGSALSKLEQNPKTILKFLKANSYSRTVSAMAYNLNTDEVINSNDISMGQRIQYQYPSWTEFADYPLELGNYTRDRILREYFVYSKLAWITAENLGLVKGNTCFSVKITATSYNLYDQSRNVQYTLNSGTNHEWITFDKITGSLSGKTPDTLINIPVTFEITSYDGIFKITREFNLTIEPSIQKTKLEGFLCHNRGDIILLNLMDVVNNINYNLSEPLNDIIKEIKQPAHKLVRVYEHASGLLVYETKSNVEDGRFEIEVIPGDYYIVISSIPGFDPIKQNSKVIDKIRIL